MPHPIRNLSLHGDEKTCLDDGSLSSLDLNAVFLTIHDDALEVLKSSLDRRDRLELHTGPAPQIVLGDGDTPLNLKVSLEQFRHEIYTNKASSSRLDFRSLVHQRAECQVDNSYLAMQAVRSSMATIASEQEARQAVTRSDVMFDAKKKKVVGTVNRGASGPKLSSSSMASGRSPNPGSANVPSSTDIRQKAMTKVISHFLAIRPASDQEISQRTSVGTRDRTSILPKIAALDTQTQKWTLRDRAYKDIRVWDFKWPRASERESAIEAAIRAYDRLRLGRDDELWQHLLPKEDRNKGKVLSRLHSGTAQKAQAPVVRPPPASQGSGTPRSVVGNASPMPGSATGTATASPAGKTAASGPGARSNLEAMLKGSRKAAARAGMTPRDSKEPKDKAPTKSANSASKYKTSDLITESDEDDETSSSSGGSVRSSNELNKPTQPSQRRNTNGQDARPTAGASPLGLLGPSKPTVRKIVKSSSERSAQNTPSHPLEKTSQKAAPTRNDRDANLQVPSSSALSARSLGSPNPGSLNKQSVARKRPSESTSNGPVQSLTVNKKRELDSDNEGSRPRKVSRVNGNGISDTRMGNSNATSRRGAATNELGTQRSEQNLKRKADALSRNDYDDYDRQRARKQTRADSSSVTSAATVSSVGTTSSSNATTAQTSLGSPSFSGHSPASMVSSHTSNSSRDSSLARSAKWSLERALDEAERFQARYYPEYMALYDRVEKQGNRARPEDRKQLLAMHHRLKEMKHNITIAAG